MLTVKCPYCNEFYEISHLQCPNCASLERTGKDLSGAQPSQKESDNKHLQQWAMENEPPASKKFGYAVFGLTIAGLALFALLSRRSEEPLQRVTRGVTPHRALIVTPLFKASQANKDTKIIHSEYNAPNKVPDKKETPEKVSAQPHGILHSEFNVPIKKETPEKPVAQPNGLFQLCNDWLFYRKMIAHAKEEGDTSKLADYQDALEIVNSWLGDYKEEDIQAVMGKIDKNAVYARSEERQE